MPNLLRASVPYKGSWTDPCTSDTDWRNAVYSANLFGDITSLSGKGTFAANGCTDPSGMLYRWQPVTPQYLVEADWVGSSGGGYLSTTELVIHLLQTKVRTDWATGMNVPEAREKGDFVKAVPNNGNVPSSNWLPWASKDLWESSNVEAKVTRTQNLFFGWETKWAITYQYRAQEDNPNPPPDKRTVTKTATVASGSLSSSLDLSAITMGIFVANDKEVALSVNGALAGAGTLPYAPSSGNQAISWLGLGRRYPGVSRSGPGSHRITRFRLLDV